MGCCNSKEKATATDTGTHKDENARPSGASPNPSSNSSGSSNEKVKQKSEDSERDRQPTRQSMPNGNGRPRNVIVNGKGSEVGGAGKNGAAMKQTDSAKERENRKKDPGNGRNVAKADNSSPDNRGMESKKSAAVVSPQSAASGRDSPSNQFGNIEQTRPEHSRNSHQSNQLTSSGVASPRRTIDFSEEYPNLSMAVSKPTEAQPQPHSIKPPKPVEDHQKWNTLGLPAPASVSSANRPKAASSAARAEQTAPADQIPKDSQSNRTDSTAPIHGQSQHAHDRPSGYSAPAHVAAPNALPNTKKVLARSPTSTTRAGGVSETLISPSSKQALDEPKKPEWEHLAVAGARQQEGKVREGLEKESSPDSGDEVARGKGKEKETQEREGSEQALQAGLSAEEKAAIAKQKEKQRLKEKKARQKERLKNQNLGLSTTTARKAPRKQ